MRTIAQLLLPAPDILTVKRERPSHSPATVPVTPKDFPERHDDPNQAEELERQQDA